MMKYFKSLYEITGTGGREKIMRVSSCTKKNGSLFVAFLSRFRTLSFFFLKYIVQVQGKVFTYISVSSFYVNYKICNENVFLAEGDKIAFHWSIVCLV